MTKMKILMGTLTMACMLTWLIGTTSDASSATPGSVNDPIVTKSYVDQKDGELKAEIDARLLALEEGTAGTTTGDTTLVSGDVDMEAIYSYIDDKVAEMEVDQTSGETTEASSSLFSVVEAKNGQRLICGASAEIILRAGTATVIAGANGDGLADLTTGVDLRGDDQVPAQHHLLVSRDDGRGLLITSITAGSDVDAYILVKGAYTLE